MIKVSLKFKVSVSPSHPSEERPYYWAFITNRLIVSAIKPEHESNERFIPCYASVNTLEADDMLLMRFSIEYLIRDLVQVVLGDWVHLIGVEYL
jgi:hypothetical protein